MAEMKSFPKRPIVTWAERKSFLTRPSRAFFDAAEMRRELASHRRSKKRLHAPALDPATAPSKSSIIARALFFGVRVRDSRHHLIDKKAHLKRSARPHDSATTTASRPVAKARQGLWARFAVARVFRSKFEEAYRQKTSPTMRARPSPAVKKHMHGPW